MVIVRMQGRIGNNLFQYAFARLIAEQLGLALEVVPPDTNSADALQTLFSQFADAPWSIEGQRLDAPVERHLHGRDGFDGHVLDMAALLSDPTPRRVELRGMFERYEYYQPFKEQIRGWFEIEPLACGHEIGNDDLVVHVRRGDYVALGRALDLSIYDQMLEGLRWRRLFLVGDQLDALVLRHFRRFEPIVVHNDPVSDFRFLLNFSQIVGSQSTFCWWAAFLSPAHTVRIAMPGMASEHNQRNPGSDLVVTDEPR